MIDIIAVVLLVLLVVVFLWLLQPYKNWKKNFDNRQYEPITITNQQHQKLHLPEYL